MVYLGYDCPRSLASTGFGPRVRYALSTFISLIKLSCRDESAGSLTSAPSFSLHLGSSRQTQQSIVVSDLIDNIRCCSDDRISVWSLDRVDSIMSWGLSIDVLRLAIAANMASMLAEFLAKAAFWHCAMSFLGLCHPVFTIVDAKQYCCRLVK